MDLGYVIARFMHFYHYSLDAILDLPMKQFYFLSRQIDRIEADKDLRLLHGAVSATSSEGYKQTYEALTAVKGTVYTYEPVALSAEAANPEKATGQDPEFDRAGLHRLKLFK